MAYSQEFLQNYKQPKIENIIVGFSGIDPTPKKTEIDEITAIDCGEIEAEAEPETEA